MEQPNQERIRTLGGKENYKYSGILEVDPIKQVKMKEKDFKKYLTWTRELFEIKHCSIKEINTWAVSLVRYLGLFLKWTREDLQQMN